VSKPTKAQRRIMDALAGGAVLQQWALSYWWSLRFPNGAKVTVDPRTVYGCWKAGLLDNVQPATMGLTDLGRQALATTPSTTTIAAGEGSA
jgi:hypothetical protein